MRRVLVLIKGLGRGGAEQLLVSAAPHLDRQRFAYRVAYMLPHKDQLVEELHARGVATTCLGDAGMVAVPRRLRRLVRQEQIDVVHVHSPVAAAMARTALPRTGPPIVYTEHNVWARYHPATRAANALTYGRNAWVFTVSDEVRRSLGAGPWPTRGHAALPVETLYHGPEPVGSGEPDASDRIRAELGVPRDAPLVGAVGNLKTHKGYGFLLEAAARVVRRIPDARFVVVGQGPLEAALRRQRDELGLQDHVTFTGYRADAPTLAGAFDVFVMSSLQEGLSIALLEAMARGRPVVVTRVGGLPEVVRDGVDGLLVPPRDVDAMADALLRLVRDPQLRARLGTAARARAAGFDIRTAVARMETVYEAVA